MKRKPDIGWVKDVVAVAVFLFLFPYFAISFKQQKEDLLKDETKDTELQICYEQISELPHNENYFVVWEDDGTRLKLPIENFLIGALAASIPVTYEEEVLRAQVILLRSTVCGLFEEAEADMRGVKTITLKDGEGNFWTDRHMQSAWGENYDENLKKCTIAVLDTQGIYLAYAGKPVEGYYHGMSAGRTRDGKELSEEEILNYLKVAECTENLSDQSFVTEMEVKKEETGKLEEDQRTEDGYVISVKRDGRQISGELLREELGLASSNFSWREENNSYIFSVKGFGHGFGLDQYYGNILATEGKEYKEIINYFFADVTFQKME